MEIVKKISDFNNNIPVTSKEILREVSNDPEYSGADVIMVLAYYKEHDYYNFAKSGELSRESKLWHVEQWRAAILRGDA